MADRARAWSDTRIVEDLAANGFLKKNLLAGLSISQSHTVVRIVLDVWMIPGHAEETEFVNACDLGIGVTSAEAFTAETLPDPNAVADYPLSGWMYIATQPVKVSRPTEGIIHLGAHFKADIRAQRKIDRGVLFAYFDNIAQTGTAQPVTITGRIRALALL